MPPPSATFSTRERILAYLAENHLASVQALSRAWGLTRADIRYHFTTLVKEGLVELVPRDPAVPVQRGRPERFYRLPSIKAAHNLPDLCSALLHALRLLPDERREEAAAQISQQMARGFSPPANATQRLSLAAAFLSERGYRARWEAGLQGPRILLRNCPYATILSEHPEMCGIDQIFLETLTGIPLRQAARVNLSTGKPPACIFAFSG